MEWAIPDAGGLWRSALAVVPLAIACAAICGFLPLRPASRHTIWVGALLAFLLPVLLPTAPQWDWLSLPSIASTHPIGDRQPDPRGAASLPPATDFERLASAEPSAFLPTQNDRAYPGQEDSAASFAGFPRSGSAATDSTLEAESASVPRAASFVASGSSSPTAPPPTRSASPSNARRSKSEPRARASRSESHRSEATARKLMGALPATHGNDAPIQTTTSARPTVERASDPAGPPAGIDRTGEWTLALQAIVGTWIVAGFAAVAFIYDWLLSLPPMPTGIWIAGSLVLVLLHVFRVLRFRRVLSRGLVPPAVVSRSVAEVAESIGLARPPRTLMVNERVSPLIWCGRVPTLILPVGLWTQLDKHGRKAILCHELAHLKRRDHWVSWFEQAAAALYWWNPLLWWIRKRIHEEADLSCDVWVTWLMPQGRRAYAEALLRTNQYVSSSRLRVPAGGMAVASGRARTFARRLTMVMTRSDRPRKSLAGLMVATSIATIGWVAAPAWSCPRDEKKPEKKRALVSTSPAQKGASAGTCIATTDSCSAHSPVTCTTTIQGVPSAVASNPYASGSTQAQADAPCASAVTVPSPLIMTVPATHDPFTHASSFMPFATAASQGQPDNSSGVSLYYQLANRQQSADSAKDDRLDRLEEQLKELSRQLKEMRGQARRPGASGSGGGAGAGVARGGGVTSAGPVRAWRAPGQTDNQHADSGAIVVRGYELPAGKLDALFNLMVRDDVPIRVRKDGTKLEVHATEGQHKIVRAFIDIINPGGKSGAAARALAPTVAGRFPGAASNLDALRLQESLASLGGLTTAPEQTAKRMRELRAALPKKLSGEARARVGDQLRSLEGLLRSRIEGNQHAAEHLQAEAEELAKNAERMTEEAARMAEQAAEAAGADAKKEQSRAMERAAREMERKARAIEKEARAAERKAAEAESKADEFDDGLNELNELLESMDSDMDDDGGDMDDDAAESEDMIEVEDNVGEKSDAAIIELVAPPATPTPPSAPGTPSGAPLPPATPPVAPVPAGSAPTPPVAPKAPDNGVAVPVSVATPAPSRR